MKHGLRRIVTLASGVLSTGCPVFGYHRAAKQPDFTVVERVGAVAIRHYGSRLVAQTIVPDSDLEDARQVGFKRLASYIFGNNVAEAEIAMTAPVSQSSQKIPMTAPVSQARTGPDYRIHFFCRAS